jgi:hypothetical protein
MPKMNKSAKPTAKTSAKPSTKTSAKGKAEKKETKPKTLPQPKFSRYVQCEGAAVALTNLDEQHLLRSGGIVDFRAADVGAHVSALRLKHEEVEFLVQVIRVDYQSGLLGKSTKTKAAALWERFMHVYTKSHPHSFEEDFVRLSQCWARLGNFDGLKDQIVQVIDRVNSATPATEGPPTKRRKTTAKKQQGEGEGEGEGEAQAGDEAGGEAGGEGEGEAGGETGAEGEKDGEEEDDDDDEDEDDDEENDGEEEDDDDDDDGEVQDEDAEEA